MIYMYELQVYVLFFVCVLWYVICNCGVVIKSGEFLYVVCMCIMLLVSKMNFLSYFFELMDGCDLDVIVVQKIGSRYWVGKLDIII